MAAAGGATQLQQLVDALRATKDANTNLEGARMATYRRVCSATPQPRRRAASCLPPSTLTHPPLRPASARPPPPPGLRAFRRLLRRPAPAAALLRAYLAASPGWQELHAVWDAQQGAKSPAVALELLQLLHDLLRFEPPTPDAPESDDEPESEATAARRGGGGAGDEDGRAGEEGEERAGEGGGGARAISDALDGLARAILQRRLKAIYFNLSSGARLGRVLGSAARAGAPLPLFHCRPAAAEGAPGSAGLRRRQAGCQSS
jgi:hypothetical protein